MIREVDPAGVYNRTKRNRAIVRREYFVQYSNEMWHIDTHHKLIRWKFVIRGGVDGKSRTCLYLDAGGDNRSVTHLAAFIKATQQYGVPYRCRSDKGGENVDIAKFMLTNRGLGRASHICGRSVHNQRIERFWGDVHSGCLTQFKIVFNKLEEDGYLDVENDLSLALLHYIFQPRLQQQLKVFRESWNCHPLSTSQNMTPNQLLLMHLPPPHLDLIHPVIEEGEDSLNTSDDISRCMDGNSILNDPALNETALQSIANRLQAINPLEYSEYFGYDLFTQAFDLLQNIELTV